MKLTKQFDDPNGIVSKLVFEDDEAIAEAVAYRYEDRGVVCFSVQSGCRVGCSFCGTGKRFIRSLRPEEMYLQIKEGLRVVGKREKIQCMSMSMGEPMDNWQNVSSFIPMFFKLYPDYHFYMSSVGLRDYDIVGDLIYLGLNYNNFGLQFSLHSFDDYKRKKLLGNYPELLDLDVLVSIGRYWSTATGKPCYFNYICTGNETDNDARWVVDNLRWCHITCSVKCITKGFEKADPAPAIRFADMIKQKLYGNRIGRFEDVQISVFDPAGQDTIGGGCGQLLYVQERLKGANYVRQGEE